MLFGYVLEDPVRKVHSKIFLRLMVAWSRLFACLDRMAWIGLQNPFNNVLQIMSSKVISNQLMINYWGKLACPVCSNYFHLIWSRLWLLTLLGQLRLQLVPTKCVRHLICCRWAGMQTWVYGLLCQYLFRHSWMKKGRWWKTNREGINWGIFARNGKHFDQKSRNILRGYLSEQ